MPKVFLPDYVVPASATPSDLTLMSLRLDKRPGLAVGVFTDSVGPFPAQASPEDVAEFRLLTHAGSLQKCLGDGRFWDTVDAGQRDSETILQAVLHADFSLIGVLVDGEMIEARQFSYAGWVWAFSQDVQHYPFVVMQHGTAFVDWPSLRSMEVAGL